MSGAGIFVESLTRNFSVRVKGKPKKWFQKAETAPFSAVKDLSFSIESGAKVAFIGPNGAGKSTTLKMLCGLLKPTSGKAFVWGFVPWDETQKLARHIGLVFGQRSHLWPTLSVSDSFDLLAKIYDLEPKAYKAQREKLIKTFGIGSLVMQQARTLSLGERMRCDLAAALLHQPSVLFLDEPTIGLDVTAKALLRDHLNSLSREFETTILLTSHDTDDVERICERVILIDHGLKLIDTNLAELRREYIRYRTLTLTTEEDQPSYQREGVTTIQQSPHRLVLRVDISVIALEKVMAECLAAFQLHDIAIEDLPLEEVIKSIYAHTKAAS